MKVEGSLCTTGRTNIGLYTSSAKTPVVDFGTGGIRLVVFQLDNWIIYSVSRQSLEISPDAEPLRSMKPLHLSF